jgi:outer membrane protein OmpA-like peptidoglycan-associated protein
MPLAAGNKADVEMDLPVKELNIFRTTNVHFATDSYEIPDTAKTMLDRLAAHLLRNKTLVGRLYGHTDNVGGKDYNQTLSENRALSVIKYLASKGIPEARLTYAGHNFAEPIADNDKVQGRWYNRRVEITLIDAGIQALR